MMLSLFIALNVLASVANLGFAFRPNGFDFQLFSKTSQAPKAFFKPYDGKRISLDKKEFTFCLDVYLFGFRNYNTTEQNLFTYSIASIPFAVALDLRFRQKDIRVSIQDKQQYLKPQGLPPVEKWTHICLSWNSKDGVAKAYFDGKEVASLNKFFKGQSLLYTPEKNKLCLGQRVTGVVTPAKGLRGKITHFNTWSRELTADEVIQAQQCKMEGDIISWSNSSWVVDDHADMVPSTAPYGIRVKGLGYDCPPGLENEKLGETNTEADSCSHPTATTLDKEKFDKDEGIKNSFGQISLPQDQPLQNLTLCAWIYLNNDVPYSRLLIGISDLLGSSMNVHATKDADQLKISVLGEVLIAQVKPDAWHQLCITQYFENPSTIIYIYINGVSQTRETVDTRIVYVGLDMKFYQSQSEPFDPQNPTKGFNYKVTGINLWNFTFSGEEVWQQYESCFSKTPGNVIAWNKTKYAV